MPNWCLNNATITHEDPEMIKKINQAFEDEKLFATFAPLPTINEEWDYSAAIDTWGTKWEATRVDVNMSIDHPTETSLTFETAWGPPIEFYDKLVEQGFEVSAEYHEPGMCFAGLYEDGIDEQYSYDFTDPEWREQIANSDVVDMLEDEYDMWLESQDEEEEE